MKRKINENRNTKMEVAMYYMYVSPRLQEAVCTPVVLEAGALSAALAVSEAQVPV